MFIFSLFTHNLQIWEPYKAYFNFGKRLGGIKPWEQVP